MSPPLLSKNDSTPAIANSSVYDDVYEPLWRRNIHELAPDFVEEVWDDPWASPPAQETSGSVHNAAPNGLEPFLVVMDA